MKENQQKIFNIATVVLLIVCLLRIGELKNDISNLKNTVNNNYSTLKSSINSISNNVRYEMEQANNILSDSNWSTGDLNIKDKTAKFSCYVVPKIYNPEMTVATIICNGEEIPMVLKNGQYTAEITLPLFEETVINNVQFEDNGTIRTQQLNWGINPRYDMVPTAYINYIGSRSIDYSGKNITRSYSGYAEIDFEHKGTLVGDIKDSKIVVLINGNEKWRHEPVLEELHSDYYTSSYRAEIEHSFEVQSGDTIEMYMEFTDENGLRYRSVLENVTIASKGTPISKGDYPSEADIYDVDGNLLFQPYKY